MSLSPSRANLSHANLSRAGWRASAVPYRAVLLAVTVVAATAGFTLTGVEASHAAVRNAGSELVHLLRMMALLKVGLAAAATWLADWRLRQPLAPRLAGAYLAAAGLMAMGPGLIWDMAHVVLGAVLLHAGLAMLIVLACTDGGVAWRFLRRRPDGADRRGWAGGLDRAQLVNDEAERALIDRR